jgi:hypothetical protein
LRLLIFALAATVALAADNPWDKVRDLKSGTELRIYKRHSSQPVLAVMDEANDDNLIVVVKKEEVAIPRNDIDQIDYRPPRRGAKMLKETRETTTESHGSAAPVPNSQPGPESSSSTSFSSQPKPDFETIYRRPPPAPPSQDKK